MQSPVHRMLVPSVLAFLATTATTTSNTCPASITHDLSSTRGFTADIHPQSPRDRATGRGARGHTRRAVRASPRLPRASKARLGGERDARLSQQAAEPRPASAAVRHCRRRRAHEPVHRMLLHDEGLQTSLTAPTLSRLATRRSSSSTTGRFYSWTNIVREARIAQIRPFNHAIGFAQ